MQANNNDFLLNAARTIIQQVAGQSFKPALNLVATPIGNIGDFTLRAINTLKLSDVILCEDTNLTYKILCRLGFECKNLLHYNDFAKMQDIDNLLFKVQNGLSISLVSDAGVPGLSDPSFKIVQRARELEILVSICPGACALSSGIALAGLEEGSFCFMSFFDKQKLDFIKSNNILSKLSVVFFENPKSLPKTLQTISLELGGDLMVSVAREISKLHEEFFCFKLCDIAKFNDKINNLKGELVFVLTNLETKDFAGNGSTKAIEVCNDFFAKNAFAKNLTTQNCIDLIMQIYPSARLVPKKTLYNLIIDVKKPEL